MPIGQSARHLPQQSIAQQRCCFATKPEAAVYGGPQAKSPKRVTLRALQQKYNRGEKLTMMTAYDYPSAVHVRAPSTTCCAPQHTVAL